MTLTMHDRAQIRDLVDGYAVLVDARDFAGVAELFTTDAVLVVPEPPSELNPIRSVIGRSAIQEELSRLKDFAVTFHSVNALLVSTGRDDNLADGRVNGIAHHVRFTADGPRDLVWYVRYQDSYERTESGWLVARRALTIEMIESHAIKRANAVWPKPGADNVSMDKK